MAGRVGDKARPQRFVAACERCEGRRQCVHVQRPAQFHAAADVVRGAIGLETMQEPLALLRVGQRRAVVRRRVRARQRGDRQLREGHALLGHLVEERTALGRRQRGKARGQPGRGIGFDHSD